MKKRNALKTTVLVLGASIATVFPSVAAEPNNINPAPTKQEFAKLGDKAASLDGLTYIKGEPVSFEKGKFYVVEFWATWCAPCRTSIPHLTEFQKRFADKGVTVLGISKEEDIEKIKHFVVEQGEKMDYIVAADPKGMVSSGYMKAYQQRGIPTAFIVNAEGNVAWIGHPMGQMEDVLEQLMAGTFDSASYDEARLKRQAAKLNEEALYGKLVAYLDALKSGAGIEETQPLAKEIIAGNNPMMSRLLAWRIMMLSGIDDANRDMEMALEAITSANAETKGKDARVLDTYAMVLSKTGNLTEAIATGEKAIALAAGNERLQASMMPRLKAMKKEMAENAVEPKPAPSRKEGAKLGDKAASLDGLTYIKGEPVSFEKGRFYVVEFWATRCKPCLVSIPHLTELQKKFVDKGVTVIGISDEKEVETVRGFVAKQGKEMDYTVATDTTGQVLAGYMGAYKRRGIPAVFIVDGNGNVAWFGHPMKGLEEVLEQVIAGTFDSAAFGKAKAEQETTERKLHELVRAYTTAASSGAGIEETRPIAEEIIEAHNPMISCTLALRIMSVSNIDDANRDMEIAIKAAAQAARDSNNKDSKVLDIYAMVLTKNGQLAEAIAIQEKAIAAAKGDKRAQDGMKHRLNSLKKSQRAKEPAARETSDK